MTVLAFSVDKTFFECWCICLDVLYVRRPVALANEISFLLGVAGDTVQMVKSDNQRGTRQEDPTG